MYNYSSDDADYDEVDIDEELRHRLMFNILMVLDEEQDHLFKVMLQFNRIIQVFFFNCVL